MVRKTFYSPRGAFIGKPRPNTGKQDYLNRLIKRANRANGYDSGRSPYEWEYAHADMNTLEGYSGKVIALTKSEARAKIKKEMGLSKNKRLPKGILIQRGEKCQN